VKINRNPDVNCINLKSDVKGKPRKVKMTKNKLIRRETATPI
jgi:hypothetical protein